MRANSSDVEQDSFVRRDPKPFAHRCLLRYILPLKSFVHALAHHGDLVAISAECFGDSPPRILRNRRESLRRPQRRAHLLIPQPARSHRREDLVRVRLRDHVVNGDQRRNIRWDWEERIHRRKEDHIRLQPDHRLPKSPQVDQAARTFRRCRLNRRLRNLHCANLDPGREFSGRRRLCVDNQDQLTIAPRRRHRRNQLTRKSAKTAPVIPARRINGNLHPGKDS